MLNTARDSTRSVFGLAHYAPDPSEPAVLSKGDAHRYRYSSSGQTGAVLIVQLCRPDRRGWEKGKVSKSKYTMKRSHLGAQGERTWRT